MTSSDDDTGPVGRARRVAPRASDALTPSLYAELRRVAAGYLRGERRAVTLQPTALVHEAFLRLVAQREVAWQNRAQVLGVAAQLMRRVLVDHARARGRVKRAGLLTRVPLEEGDAVVDGRDVELLALDEALVELAELDEQLCRVVEMRYFGGLTVEEMAEALETSPRSVDRAWSVARAWLRRRLAPEGDGA